MTEKSHHDHYQSRGPYSAPRTHADLVDEDIAVGRKQAAKLMQVAGLQGVSRRKTPCTTIRRPETRPTSDLVQRNFRAEAPNRLWVADITYLLTRVGFFYLAVVLDVLSRRVVGWAMANHLRTQMVLDALDMACQQRRPIQVIHHADQGSQYTSLAFGHRCKQTGVRPSMGSVDDCYDNALCESFFATLECEFFDRQCFESRHQARLDVFRFIEGWYNPRRRHSALDDLSPIEYERRYPSRVSIQVLICLPKQGNSTSKTRGRPPSACLGEYRATKRCSR